jgi:hypothetical protein
MGGGQQGGFGGNQMGGGFNQQPMQQPMGGFGGGYGQQQMQQPMGGFGQMGGGYGQMGGFGGGYGQYGQMRGGFGQQQPFGQQMGFNQQRQMQQPMGGFGGGFGGGYNPMGDMGQMNRGFNQQQMGGFGGQMDGGFGGQMGGGFNQQGGQGLQGQMNSMSSLLRGMPMGQQGGMQGGMGMAGLGQSPGMSGTASPQMNAQFQAFMNQSAGRPDNYGRESSQGMGGSPVTTSDAQAIPEYARPYAQNMMGGAFGALSQPGQGRQGIQGLMGGNLSQNSGMPTQSQMMGTQAPSRNTGRSMTPDEFSAMMQSAYGRSA